MPCRFCSASVADSDLLDSHGALGTPTHRACPSLDSARAAGRAAASHSKHQQIASEPISSMSRNQIVHRLKPWQLLTWVALWLQTALSQPARPASEASLPATPTRAMQHPRGRRWTLSRLGPPCARRTLWGTHQDPTHEKNAHQRDPARRGSGGLGRRPASLRSRYRGDRRQTKKVQHLQRSGRTRRALT